jgi:glutamate-1-semialdehyde 2,1-aminomutase
MAAGLAAVSHLEPTSYSLLRQRAADLARGLTDVLAGAGLAVHLSVAGSLVGLHFGDEPPVDYDSARRTDEKRYASFFHAMLERGVALAPSQFEAAFVSLAHGEADIDLAARAAAHAMVVAT